MYVNAYSLFTLPAITGLSWSLSWLRRWRHAKWLMRFREIPRQVECQVEIIQTKSTVKVSPSHAQVPWHQADRSLTILAPVPLTIFQSNSKLDQIFKCSGLKMYSTNHNEILHTSRQCNCRDVCKISVWSVEHVLNFTKFFIKFNPNIVSRTGGQLESMSLIYLNQCWLIENWNLENRLPWNLNQNTTGCPASPHKIPYFSQNFIFSINSVNFAQSGNSLTFPRPLDTM